MTTAAAQPVPPYPHPSETLRPAIRVEGLRKVYGSGESAVDALAGIDLEIAAGRFTAVMGPSGSGKSTLLHCVAGLDAVTAGHIGYLDRDSDRWWDITTMSDRDLTRFRRDRIGFVFQSFNLLPTLTAAQNILLPLDLAGRKVDRGWFDGLVDTLGIAARLDHRPSELSGGQQQRVACARALVTRPAVVFADEPTGNLDSRSSAEVLSFLRRSVRELGQTVVMVTHDPSAASYADRAVLVADGLLARDIDMPEPQEVLDALGSLGDDRAGSPSPASSADLLAGPGGSRRPGGATVADDGWDS